MRQELKSYVAALWSTNQTRDPAAIVFDKDGEIDIYSAMIRGHWILDEESTYAVEVAEEYRRTDKVSAIKWLHEVDDVDTYWVVYADRVWAFSAIDFEQSPYFGELRIGEMTLPKLIVSVRRAIICYFESGCYSVSLPDGDGTPYIISVRDGCAIPTVTLEYVVVEMLEYLAKVYDAANL